MVKIIESSYAREKQVKSILLQISVDNMSAAKLPFDC